MPERVEIIIQRNRRDGTLIGGFAARTEGMCEIEAMAKAISLAQGMINRSQRFSKEYHIYLEDFTFNLSEVASDNAPELYAAQTADLQESVSTT